MTKQENDFFAGKTAVITGAAQGIGLAIAEKYAASGVNCAMIDISETVVAAAGNLKNEFPVEILPLCVDISDEKACDEAFREIFRKFGSIDFLVNNAGITRDNLLVRMSEEDFSAVISVNLKGTFLASKAAARVMMKKRQGRIINISSVVGQMGNAGQTNYAASKAGIIGLTKSLARELASRNILVNAVAPGFVKTDMTEKLKSEIKEKLLKMIPLGRFAEPRDVANAVIFLSGENSSYITGEVLAVNGGIYI